MAYIDKKNNIIRLIEKYPTPALKEREIIANKLGFQYVPTKDSVISISRIRGIDGYNLSMGREIKKIHGMNFLRIWLGRSDSLFRENSYEKMKAAVLEIPEVKEYAKYLDSISNGKEKPYVIVFVDVVEDNAHVGRLNKNGSISIHYNYTIDPYSLKSTTIKY